MATQTAISTLGRNRLEGKVAIITGGDQGIGRAIVLRLAAEGADIAFCYRSNRAGAEEVAGQITKQCCRRTCRNAPPRIGAAGGCQ